LNGARGCLFDSLGSPLKPKEGLNGARTRLEWGTDEA
jgi:hypothetical protein